MIDKNTLNHIAAEMGINAKDIAQRKAFLELTEKDVEQLHQLDKKLLDFQEEFVNKFYQHVLEFEEMRQIIPDKNSLEKLKKSQLSYFKSLTSEQFDWDYVLSRLQVGVTHQRVGMDIKWYIGGYRKYLTLLLNYILGLPDYDKKQLSQDFNSILKIVSFDMGLAIETYTYANNLKITNLEKHLDNIIQGIDGFIWEFDVKLHQYVFVSPQSETILGYYQHRWLENPKFHHQIVHPDDFEKTKRVFNYAVSKGEHQDIEYRVIVNNGETLWINERISVVKNQEGKVTLLRGLILDIQQRKKYEKQLAYMASYDNLTALPNRAFFKSRLNNAVSSAKREGSSFAILFIDLDGFKSINDSMGHTIGDKLLQTLGSRINNTLRKQEFAARFGGDEFCIILENITSNHAVVSMANRCLNILEKPVSINNHNIFPRASIGIAMYPDDGDTSESLLQCADNAMYAAKDAGKHQFAFYNKLMTEQAASRLEIENDLRQALKKNEFELYYQPQIALNTGKLIAVEALIRWHHPEKGMVPPDQFISIAEEIGLIIPLGVWVLNQACCQMAEWKKASIPVDHVAINISSLHFCDKTLAADVISALSYTGLQACDIELEITETVMQTNNANADNFRIIKDLGVNIAIDDFGTGYSCLSSLTELPLDSLKIDRSFINDVLENSNKATIVATIIAMSRALGFAVVAEGAETIEQVIYLQGIGCDMVQGYYFSKPVPAEQIPELANTNFLNKP